MTPPVTTVRPDGDLAGEILIVHGLAEHKGRYAYVQRSLANAGYASAAIDLRGHGEADGFPGKVGSPDEWLEDIEEGIGLAREDDSVPFFVIAHSMGTLPTLAYVGERGQDGIRGVVLSACPITPGELQLEALTNPDAPGVPPEALSRDPEVVRAYIEDPLVFSDVPAECTAAVLLCAQRAYAACESVTLPVLLIHGGDDPIALASGSQEINDALATADKRLIVYDGLYHEIFNEPERDQVLGDVIGWVDAHR